MALFDPEKPSAGGGGVALVKELPKPKEGKVVYLKEDQWSIPLVSGGDFNQFVTVASLQNTAFDGYQAESGNIFTTSGTTAGGAFTGVGVRALGVHPSGNEIGLVLTNEARTALGNPASLLITLDGETTPLAYTNIGSGLPARYKGTLSRSWIGLRGQQVSVRITGLGGQTGITEYGVLSIGDRPPGAEVLYEKNYYHVDPDTGEWVEGLGSGIGGGGIPAAWIPENGLSDADTRNHIWKGILVGLAREDAGADWALLSVAGADPVQARAEISNAADTATLTIEFDIGAVGGIVNGAAGNNANVSLVSSGDDSVRIDSVAPSGAASIVATVRIWVNALTFDRVAQLANAVNGLSATVTGDGTQTFPTPPSGQTLVNFSGGVNGADLGISVDPAQKFVEIVHHTGHTQQEIVDLLHENKVDNDTTLYAILIRNSNPTATIKGAPLHQPFVEIFSQGSLPRPTEAELEALGRRIDDLSFSDLSGQAGDGQIPTSITRDSEITRDFLRNILNPELYVAAVSNATPAAGDFGSASRGPVNLVIADGERIAIAYLSTLGTPVVLVDGVRDTTSSVVAGTITLGGVAHTRVVTEELFPNPDGVLIEVRFV